MLGTISGKPGRQFVKWFSLLAFLFGIAAISKRWFEDPILRLKRHFESR